jgi:hypothetical protein
MCKGQQSTTTSQTPNPTALAAYNNLIGSAQQVGSTPFIPYTGQQVAPQTPETNTGIMGVNEFAGAAQPAINTAQGLLSNSAIPLTSAQIQNYFNPYVSNVIGATEQQFNLQNAQQQNQLTGNAASAGALGGNRLGVAQAQLAGQQQINEAPTIAQLAEQGYTQAIGTAEQQYQANPEAAAYGIASTGVAGQQAGLQGASSQIQAGQTQQQTQQAIDTAAYNYYLMQAAYPEQQLNFEAGIDTGVGSLMGGTGVTQGPTPSILGGAAGLGLTGLGLYNSGAFSGIGAALPALAAVKRGGRVPEYDAGGAATGVGPLPYGAGALPYGNPSGYVPSLQITHGRGPPAPPNPVQPQNAGQQISQFGNLYKTAMGSGSGSNASSGNDWAAGADEPDSGFLADIGSKSGGRIPHFDTGGGADDDTGVLPPSSGFGTGSFQSADNFLPPSAGQPIQTASLDTPASDASGVAPEHSTSPSMDAKRGVTVAMNGNSVPNGVLQDATYLVKQGASSQDLQSFMARNGYPMDGNWCGEFAADVVHAMGGQAPPGAAVATNWMKWGHGVDPSQKDVNDAVVFPRGHAPGETGGHVGFVQKTYPDGSFDVMGGNQGKAVRHYDSDSGAVFRRGDYTDSAAGVASTNTVDPSGQGEAEARGLPRTAQAATPGVANDAGMSPGNQALIAAGLGMMASGSPYPLQQIGQGGLQGLQAYSQAKTRDLAVQRLGVEADKARRQLDIEQQNADTNRQTSQGNLSLRQAEIAKMGRQVTPAGILDLNTGTLTKWDGTTMKVGPSSGAPSSASSAPVQSAPLAPPGPSQSAVTPPATVPGSTVPPMPGGPQRGAPAAVAPTATAASVAPASIMDDPRLSTAIQLPDQMPFDSRMMTTEGAKIPIQEADEKIKKATDANDAAQNMKYRLDEFEHAYGNLPDSGWMAPGKGLEERQTVAAAANTLTRMLGQGNVIDPQQLASSEELKKLSTTMGFDLARTLGSREAQMIVRQAVGSVPSGELSPQGARRLVAGLRAAAQRQEDYYSGLQSWSARNNGSVLGYDDWFNKTHSPEKYAMRAQAEIMDKQAYRAGKTGSDVVTVLRQHPDAVSKFDARYGTPGLGAYLLSQ